MTRGGAVRIEISGGSGDSFALLVEPDVAYDFAQDILCAYDESVGIAPDPPARRLCDF